MIVKMSVFWSKGKNVDASYKKPSVVALSPGSLLKNGVRREPDNIRKKSCRLPAFHHVINVGRFHFGNSCHVI